jgi:hypothetical protein
MKLHLDYACTELSRGQKEQLEENKNVYKNVDEVRKLLQLSRGFRPASEVNYVVLKKYTEQADILQRSGKKVLLPYKVEGGPGGPRKYDSRVRATFLPLAKGFASSDARNFITYEMSEVRKKCEDTVFIMNPCPAQSFGRLLGVRANEPTNVPTRDEVEKALWLSGQTVIGSVTPVSLDPDSNNVVRINRHARAGLPTLGRKEERNVSICLEIAKNIRAGVSKCADYSEAHRFMRLLADQQPELVTALAVAKEDYYSVSKFISNQCRLYTVMPLALQLAMAPAAQAYERQCINASFMGPVGEDRYGDERCRGFTSAQSATLYRGGFEKLVVPHVRYMEKTNKSSYLTCGDDCLFMVPLGYNNSITFKLDCKHFDIGQCSEVLAPLVGVMRSDMEKIDVVGARIWASYYSERNLLVGQINVVTKDMGPSGTMLQSKVNNPLATILCERVKIAVDQLLQYHFPGGKPRNGFPTKGGQADQIFEMFPTVGGVTDYSLITKIVHQVGASLGFVCKVERITRSFTMSTEFDLYAKYFSSPVPYLGYEHYYDYDTDSLTTTVDLARWAAQAQLPKRKFDMRVDPAVDQQYLLVRMTTLAFNTGIVPSFARDAQAQVFEKLEVLLSEFCKKFSSHAALELREEDEEYSELTPLQLKSVAACLRQVGEWKSVIHSLWREDKSSHAGSEHVNEDWKASEQDYVRPPVLSRVRVVWAPVLKEPTSIPVHSWRAVGRTQPRPLEIAPTIVEEVSALATARGRRKEHGRAGTEYLDDRRQVLDFDDEHLPSGRRGGGNRRHGGRK